MKISLDNYLSVSMCVPVHAHTSGIVCMFDCRGILTYESMGIHGGWMSMLGVVLHLNLFLFH